MRIVLFCENKYAIDILHPIQVEADREGGNEVLWYVHEKKISDFPLKHDVRWTTSMQETYDFMPEAIFVPGNIVPYYLPGVKIQIFHGYAARRKTIGLSEDTLIPTSLKVLISPISLRNCR